MSFKKDSSWSMTFEQSTYQWKLNFEIFVSYFVQISVFDIVRVLLLCVLQVFHKKVLSIFIIWLPYKKFFFAFLDELHHFEKFQIFLQICEKNAKIRKVVKYKVYKKLEFQKRLQLIHDIWTVNISMKIELWDFCKLFCTNISFWHTTRFTFMCVTSFSQKMTKYFYSMISLQKIFLCISPWIA